MEYIHTSFDHDTIQVMTNNPQPHIEIELQRAKNIIQYHNEINQAILDSGSFNELLDKVYRSTIQTANLGINIIRNDDQAPKAVVQTEKMDGESHSLENHEYFNQQRLDSSYMNNKLPTLQYFCSNNIERDLTINQWTSEIMHMGFKSLLAIPVMVKTKLVTTIILYSRDLGYFTESEIKRFLQLRENIAFCFNAIHLSQKNKDLEVQKDILLQEVNQKSTDPKKGTNPKKIAYDLAQNIRSHITHILDLKNVLLMEKTKGKTREYIELISVAAQKLDAAVKEVSRMNLKKSK